MKHTRCYTHCHRRGSRDGINRCNNSLQAEMSRVRNLARDRCFVPVQRGPEAYIVSYVRFSWVKRPRGFANHPTPSSAEAKERVELYFCPFLDLRSLSQGEHFTVTEESALGLVLKTWA